MLNQNGPPVPTQLLGRPFGLTALERVRQQVAAARGCHRAEIARRVCQELGWNNRSGRFALMSARVALLKLHRAGWICLPPPRNGNGNGRAYRPERWPVEPQAIECPLKEVQPVDCQLVAKPEQSKLWNSLIERYHYLGHQNLPGAQLRYLFYSSDQRLLGAIGFGAAAWKLGPRDRWIGWTAEQRRRGLDLVLNNARFLIGPWVRVAHLAGHLLSQCLRRVPEDFQQRYGWRPVLLESFVESRFAGCCYRAANWICLGPTQGRGKKGVHPVHGQPPLPVKQIWVYPLRADFRRELGVREEAADGH